LREPNIHVAQLHPLGLGRRPDHVDGGVDHRSQIDGVGLDPELARGDARHVQEVLDDVGLQPGVPLHALQRARGGGPVEAPRAEHRDLAEHRVERCSQLVGEGGQEIVLGGDRADRVRP
jgi:hypothetical protein